MIESVHGALAGKDDRRLGTKSVFKGVLIALSRTAVLSLSRTLGRRGLFYVRHRLLRIDGGPVTCTP